MLLYKLKHCLANHNYVVYRYWQLPKSLNTAANLSIFPVAKDNIELLFVCLFFFCILLMYGKYNIQRLLTDAVMAFNWLTKNYLLKTEVNVTIG